MPAGRPTLLTPEIQEKIVSYLNAGNFLETAAALAGVDKRTVRNWLSAGGAALRSCRKHDREPTENESLNIGFLHAVGGARAFAQARHVTNITSVGMGRPGQSTETVTERTLENGIVERTITRTVVEGRNPNWQASAWFLERTDYEHWGRKDRHEVTGKDGGAIGLTLDVAREILSEAGEPSPDEATTTDDD